jgi:hypothetical protein
MKNVKIENGKRIMKNTKQAKKMEKINFFGF